MWLSKAADSLNRVMRPVVGVFHGVGVAVLALLMFLTAADVMGRYVLNKPIMGSLEISEYMMSILVAFGLAYCAIKKGHVAVELVVSRFPQRVQGITDSITGLVGLGLFSLITWRSFQHMIVVFKNGITSGVLYIPVFPFVGVVTLGSALLCLILIADLLKFLAQAVKR